MKIKFNTDKCFEEGILRLQNVLDFEISESGISLYAVCGDKIGVTYENEIATIYYSSPHHFYRELGIFLENAKTKNEFEIFEDGFFESLSAMLDVSRGAAPTVKTIKEFIDYLAVMGYSSVMFYTEDMIELSSRPYLGYMQGRYTEAELREIDDYAYSYGIEVIPCIECYGHMEKYLKWGEAYPMRDTASVLLAREEKTFEFIDELIGYTSKVFRSKKIHIGMDEAWDMGKGKFLNKHGYVKPIDIFNEYMTRLIEITSKYGLTPMMWSDMYFRTNEKSGSLYYEEETIIPESTKNIIPKEVQLVFWHYGEKPYCDDYMLKKHTELDRDIIFAGGVWSWIGHFPENDYALETTRFSLDACRKNNVRNAMMTIWFNDNAECDIFANLYGLSFTAELCYNKDADEKIFYSRFHACTGGCGQAFDDMKQYHNIFDGKETYEAFQARFLGKPLFWQDIMMGLYDSHLVNRPISGHYKKYAEQMKNAPNDKWDYLYEFAAAAFDYLAVKCEIAEKIVSAYKANDKATLAHISEALLPSLYEKTREVHRLHKEMWFRNLKPFGWNVLDLRYGGVEARCISAKERIDDYLCGKINVIEELEEERLPKGLGGFSRYDSIVYA